MGERSLLYCGKMGHQVKECPEKEKKSKKSSDQVLNVAEKVQESDDFRRKMRYEVQEENIGIAFELQLETELDSGSPVSFIKESLIPKIVIEKVENNSKLFTGINDSALEIKGIVRMNVNTGMTKRNNVTLCVPDKTMRCQVIMGSNLMKYFEFKLMESEGMKVLDDTISEIMNIEINNSNVMDETIDSLDIGSEITEYDKVALRKVIKEKYVLPERPQEPMIKMKLKLNLREHTPFHFGPRRLSFSEKTRLQEIIDKLLSKDIIRASESE